MAFHKITYADCDWCGRRIKQSEHVHAVSLSRGDIGVDKVVFGGCSNYFRKELCDECAQKVSDAINSLQNRKVWETQRCMCHEIDYKHLIGEDVIDE